MKHLLTAAAALALLAAPAMAKDVNNATILPGMDSGGLGGSIGCLYVPTNVATPEAPDGIYTLPFTSSPNTATLVAAMIITGNKSISFNLGAPSRACLGAPSAPTILKPGTP